VLAGDDYVELDRRGLEDLLLEGVARRGPGADDDLRLVLLEGGRRVELLDVAGEVDGVLPRVVVGCGDVDALLAEEPAQCAVAGGDLECRAVAYLGRQLLDQPA
jgi:hypothetical protein